jgi:hypothetical protein
VENLWKLHPFLGGEVERRDPDRDLLIFYGIFLLPSVTKPKVFRKPSFRVD